jgi:hypothetical protein
MINFTVKEELSRRGLGREKRPKNFMINLTVREVLSGRG